MFALSPLATLLLVHIFDFLVGEVCRSSATVSTAAVVVLTAENKRSNTPPWFCFGSRRRERGRQRQAVNRSGPTIRTSQRRHSFAFHLVGQRAEQIGGVHHRPVLGDPTHVEHGERVESRHVGRRVAAVVRAALAKAVDPKRIIPRACGRRHVIVVDDDGGGRRDGARSARPRQGRRRPRSAWRSGRARRSGRACRSGRARRSGRLGRLGSSRTRFCGCCCWRSGRSRRQGRRRGSRDSGGCRNGSRARRGGGRGSVPRPGRARQSRRRQRRFGGLRACRCRERRATAGDREGRS